MITISIYEIVSSGHGLRKTALRMGTYFERVNSLVANVLTILSLLCTAWSYFYRKKYVMWPSVAFFVLSSFVLLFLLVKRRIYRKVEKVLSVDDDNESYLQQLRKLSEKYSWSAFCVTKALVEIADSDNQLLPHRVRAIEGLANIGGHQVIEPLSNFLQNAPDSRIRSVAVRGLGNLEFVEVKDILFKTLRDEDSNIVKAAVSGLQNFPYSETLQKLYPLLLHNNHYIRRDVVDTIDMITSTMQAPDTGAIAPVKDLLLNDTDYEVLDRAVDILRRIGGKDALTALTSALEKRLTLDEWPSFNILKKVAAAITELEKTTRREQLWKY